MEFAIFMFVIAGFCFGMVIYTTAKKSREKNVKKEEIRQKGLEYNALFSTEINHICGLPLVEDSKCIIHLCNEQIIIESTGKMFKLQLNKIVDMDIKNANEVKNSISGAVGGYILLGPIGAFLGGSTTDFHRFFIIIYKSKADREECISFDMKDNMKAFEEIREYIEDFKNNVTEKKEIEL